MSFDRLFSPLTIGSMELRNRIVLAPHGVTFLPGYGNPIDRVIDYHVERAKGGVGLIVMSNFLMPASWKRLGSWGGVFKTSLLGNLDLVSERNLIPAYSRLAASVHEHGAKFISQLNASGRQHFSPGMINFAIPLWAPSAIPCPKTRQIPKEMELEDIEEYVETYAQAALNMLEAGADGVEVFAAQGYLLHEFLSPSTNKRTDRYGGSLENRMRFLTDILKAIRTQIPRDFVIGVRMNGDDFAPDGIDLEMAKEIARRLTTAELVDYLNISGMTYLQFPGWIADMTAPESMFAPLAAEIKSTVPETPICVVSRIGSPEAAEAVLAAGKADLVGMVRALISDPELPNKALKGDLTDIRRCTYSNQSCLMGLSSGRGVSCVHNVAAGKEAQLGIGRLRPAKRSKRIVVVGGGPAGMAAARVAIERGHAVTLYEKGPALGGQNRMTAAIKTRRGFAEVTRWQEHRLRRLGADIRLGVEATAGLILASAPGAVIVATGSVPRRTGYTSLRPDVPIMPGADQDNVFTVWDVFRNIERIGNRVVVVDEDPHLSGAYTGEHLADQGRDVEIVTSRFHAASELHINHVPELYRRLRPKGIVVSANSLVLEIAGDTVICADRFSDERYVIDGIDSVILAMGNEADDRLYRDLKGSVKELYAIGDCLAPRRIDDAVLDGERSGWML